ncbi:MAG: N-acetyltransferase [Acetilactobacillus jinshanensis]
MTIDPNWSKISVDREGQQIDLINHTLGNVIILIKSADRDVGLVTVQEVKSGIGELGVAVEKRYWNLGLGTRLVQEAIRWFKTFSHLTTLFLTVENRNQAAVHVYRKCGFRFVKTIWLRGHALMAQEMKISKKVIKK